MEAPTLNNFRPLFVSVQYWIEVRVQKILLWLRLNEDDVLYLTKEDTIKVLIYCGVKTNSSTLIFHSRLCRICDSSRLSTY